MRKPKTTKNTNISLIDLNYYKPYTRTNTTTTLYESKRGNNESKTFRLKKTSTFTQLNYSSCLNPFSRAKWFRDDKQVLQLCQTKRKVFPKSNHVSDPITLKYQRPQKQIRVNPQFQSSFQSKKLADTKYILPSDRQFSKNNKKYHRQVGMSYSCEKFPKTRERINSSNKIKSILQYSQANHKIHQITDKVGHRTSRF